jgi:hypothetical protein
VRWPTSLRRFSEQPSKLSRAEVLGRQKPPYTVEIFDPIYGDWVIRMISPTFGPAFTQYAKIDWPAKRLVDGTNRVVVFEIDQ